MSGPEKGRGNGRLAWRGLELESNMKSPLLSKKKIPLPGRQILRRRVGLHAVRGYLSDRIPSVFRISKVLNSLSANLCPSLRHFLTNSPSRAGKTLRIFKQQKNKLSVSPKICFAQLSSSLDWKYHTGNFLHKRKGKRKKCVVSSYEFVLVHMYVCTM